MLEGTVHTFVAIKSIQTKVYPIPGPEVYCIHGLHQLMNDCYRLYCACPTGRILLILSKYADYSLYFSQFFTNPPPLPPHTLFIPSPLYSPCLAPLSLLHNNPPAHCLKKWEKCENIIVKNVGRRKNFLL
jgi:hypothetical protein